MQASLNQIISISPLETFLWCINLFEKLKHCILRKLKKCSVRMLFAKHSTPGWEISEKVQFRKLKDIYVSWYDFELEISTKKQICSYSFRRQSIALIISIRIIICFPEDRETFAKIVFPSYFFRRNMKKKRFFKFSKSIENINVSFSMSNYIDFWFRKIHMTETACSKFEKLNL